MVLVIRRLRRDERGVASTVGTIMALLVFLTFLSLIVNQYVPVWMKDSEAAHVSSAIGQFGSIKGAVDLQIMEAIIAQNPTSNVIFVPTPTSTAVTLGLDGFPIFSAPTSGTLTLSPTAGAWNVSFTYTINNVPIRFVQNASGALDLNAQNRYYIPQEVVYENGAVIRSQQDGQVVRAPNVFSATNAGGKLALSFELVTLYGQGSLTGTTTEVVITKVFGANQQTYGGITGNTVQAITSHIKIRHTSLYGQAWFNFLNGSLAQGFGLSTVGVSGGPSTWTFTHNSIATFFTWKNYYSIWANYTPTTGMYVMDLDISNFYPISSFTLQSAFVQVGLGDQSNANL